MKKISRAEWFAFHKKRTSKYNAQKTIIDGEEFPSKLEAATWMHLLMLQKQGALKDVVRYDSIQLVAKNGNKYRYKPDFRATDAASGLTVWIEAKGFETATWLRNKRAWKISGPGSLWIYKAKRGGVYLAEIVGGA